VKEVCDRSVSSELQEARGCQVACGQPQLISITKILGGLESQQSLGTAEKTNDVRKDKETTKQENKRTRELNLDRI